MQIQIILLPLILSMTGEPPQEPAPGPAWQDAPSVPLDQRIDPGKMTESPLPPLPNSITDPPAF